MYLTEAALMCRETESGEPCVFPFKFCAGGCADSTDAGVAGVGGAESPGSQRGHREDRPQAGGACLCERWSSGQAWRAAVVAPLTELFLPSDRPNRNPARQLYAVGHKRRGGARVVRHQAALPRQATRRAARLPCLPVQRCPDS